MTAYYIAPSINTTSGRGTSTSNPYGINDLFTYIDNGTASYSTAGAAITNLIAGDTLYFMAGTYDIYGVTQETGNTNAYTLPILGVPNSGTSDTNRITIRNRQGDAVIINQISNTRQFIFGGPANYITYKGLTIYQDQEDSTQSVSLAFYIEGNHNEIAYCKLVGHKWIDATGDNHDIIVLSCKIDEGLTCANNHIHHNEICGVKNTASILNSAGIKNYNSGPTLVEDNYVHDCSVGIYDKSSGSTALDPVNHQNTYRRNYIVNNDYWAFSGPFNPPGRESTTQFYDNVLDMTLLIGRYEVDSVIRNNLITGLFQADGSRTSELTGFAWGEKGDQTYYNRRIQIYNNVVFSPNGDPFVAGLQRDCSFMELNNSLAPLAYMAYNVYTGTPTYWFGYYDPEPTPTPHFTSQTLQVFQDDHSGEIGTRVVSAPTDIYDSIDPVTGFNLVTIMQTAGKDGGPVGPAVPIGGTGGIMDTTRYGPGALSEVTPLPGYYISPTGGATRTGTFEDPYSIDDLFGLTGTGSTSYYTAGIAITRLAAGDTLYFMEGTYDIQGVLPSVGNTNDWQQGILWPTTSGSSGSPITIRNQPGANVVINQTSYTKQPIFGGDEDYIVYMGFTINQDPGASTEPSSTSFYIRGSNNEICYNKIVAHTWTDTGVFDRDAIRLSSESASGIMCANNYIHHNEISGVAVVNYLVNSAGIKNNNSGPTRIEDNYIHGCTYGIYDRATGWHLDPPVTHNIDYKRNWIDSNTNAFLGPQLENELQATLTICDNVLDQTLQLGLYQTDTLVYNNLFTSLEIIGAFSWTEYTCLTFGRQDITPTTNFGTEFYNNVVIAPASPFIALQQWSSDFVALNDSNAPLSYFGYNIYTGTPSYYFGTPGGTNTHYSLTQFQAQGGEPGVQVVAGPTNIYDSTNTDTGYHLLSQWQNSGRSGTEPLGPRVALTGTGGIMNATSYGPGAIPASAPTTLQSVVMMMDF